MKFHHLILKNFFSPLGYPWKMFFWHPYLCLLLGVD